MGLALNNLKRVDMPLNKETKPNLTGTTTPGQNWSGRRGNEEVVYRTGASPAHAV